MLYKILQVPEITDVRWMVHTLSDVINISGSYALTIKITVLEACIFFMF